MKKIILLLALLTAGVLFAQDKNAKKQIEVSGNCTMCKMRMAKAVYQLKGVKYCDWSPETKKMDLIFNEEKISLKEIEMAIATAGHDTPMFKATDEAYESLADCCHYRDEEASKEHH